MFQFTQSVAFVAASGSSQYIIFITMQYIISLHVHADEVSL
jgi:hypothetical protein